MNLARHEIRTGLLVLLTLAALVAALITIGAPGVWRKMRAYRVYFDDAGGIQPGAAVMLSGRRIGQVRRLVSPVPEAERPQPRLAAIVEVEVEEEAEIYRGAQVRMLQYGLLGDQVIDFSAGSEASGLANSATRFIGERQPGLNEAAPMLVERLDPVLAQASRTLEALRETAGNLNRLTAKEGDLEVALRHLRAASTNLDRLSVGPLRQSLENFQAITGPDSALSRSLANAEAFTSRLTENGDLDQALQNLRSATARLDETMCAIRPGLDKTVRNAAQFTDTVKRQPWRLIWPTTKRYPGDPTPPRRPLWATPTPAPVLLERSVKRNFP